MKAFLDFLSDILAWIIEHPLRCIGIFFILLFLYFFIEGLIIGYPDAETQRELLYFRELNKK